MEPRVARRRLNRMLIVWLTIGVMVLAGAAFALSGQVEGWGKRSDFVDKDADGEPDDPDGPAKDL